MPTVPRKPDVLLLAIYTKRLIANGEPYLDDDGAAHTDTGLQLRDAEGATVFTMTGFGASIRPVVGSLALTEGAAYAARMRYKNATGWGAYGPWHTENVPIDAPTWSAISVHAFCQGAV